ncbi:MAG: 30S ribosomal protein S13 [Patescibacteria group bacterium]
MPAVRIAGVTLPDNKRIVIALSYLKGIGRSLSEKVLASANISESKRCKDLTEEEVNRIRTVIDKQGMLLEGDLVRLVHGNIKRLKEIGSWRGLRHSRHLPVRGQRTKTNSRTVRGNVRKTATSGKKPTAQKT